MFERVSTKQTLLNPPNWLFLMEVMLALGISHPVSQSTVCSARHKTLSASKNRQRSRASSRRTHTAKYEIRPRTWGDTYNTHTRTHAHTTLKVPKQLPEAVTIATAGCSSAVRATVLYKSKLPQDSRKKLTPRKSNVSIAWGKEWCKENSPVRWVSSWRASGWDQERITERVP